MSTGNSPDDLSDQSDDDTGSSMGRQSRGNSASASYPVKQPQFFQQRRPSFEPRSKRPGAIDPHPVEGWRESRESGHSAAGGPPLRVYSEVPSPRDSGPRSPRSPRTAHRSFFDDTNGSSGGGAASSSGNGPRRQSLSRDRPVAATVSPSSSRNPSRTASPASSRHEGRPPSRPPSSRPRTEERPRTDEKETKEYWLTQMAKRDDEIKATKHELTRINERRAVRLLPPRSLVHIFL